MRLLMSGFFFSTLLAVLLGGHIYLIKRHLRDTALPRWLRLTLLTVLLAGLVLMVASPLGRRVPALKDLLPGGGFGGFLWMGLLFYLLLLTALTDAGRALWRAARAAARALGRAQGAPPTKTAAPAELLTEAAPAAGADALAALPAASLTSAPQGQGEAEAAAAPSGLTRRVFLARSLSAGAVVGSFGLGGLGLDGALSRIRLPEVPVRLGRLPPALSGFRIALLSDLHIGSVLGRAFLDQVVDQTLALRPDLIAITGDLVDGPLRALAPDVEPLARLRAAHGVWFVTGNHEYYSGVEDWVAHLPKLGVQVLGNRRVSIGDRRGGASFDLVGIHDRQGAWHAPAFAPDIDAALTGSDPERERVVLAHQPVQIRQIAPRGAGLVLSGHTHGGQIWPFGLAVRLSQPYLAGLHQHDERSQIYVSRGTGFWGPPLRLGAPAEITTLVLTP